MGHENCKSTCLDLTAARTITIFKQSRSCREATLLREHISMINQSGSHRRTAHLATEVCRAPLLTLLEGPEDTNPMGQTSDTIPYCGWYITIGHMCILLLYINIQVKPTPGNSKDACNNRMSLCFLLPRIYNITSTWQTFEMAVGQGIRTPSIMSHSIWDQIRSLTLI